jgi:hypothetical protein
MLMNLIANAAKNYEVERATQITVINTLTQATNQFYE